MTTTTPTPRPPACPSCGRDWDTVKYCARGLCTGCYSTQRYRNTPRVLVRQRMPERCGSCDRKLRYRRGPKIPGTVGYAGKGLCGSCCNRAAREERALVAYVLGNAS